ncbi:MAG: hypothetical protein B9S32_05860 [Verrucomicrobia bacterium Tous-C9LFEB]|nr:MAG: hypothetical protein B9S32_05860 [Verrucomicrobia bacterium Tous-C9LFEB]
MDIKSLSPSTGLREPSMLTLTPHKKIIHSKNHARRRTQPSDQISVGIIGISGYGRVMLKSLQTAARSEGLRLVAATVINQAEEKAVCDPLRESGCALFPDYQSMLKAHGDTLDLCVIPTSIHLHKDMSLHALDGGCHVLVEKPLAGSVADANKIVQASQQSGRFVTVGFQDMFSPATHSIKEFLLSGALGQILSIRASGSWPRGQSYYSRNNWAGRLTCDGMDVFDSPLNNAFAHFLNLALYFAAPSLHDMARVAKTAGHLYRFYPIESYDTANVHLLTGEGVIIDGLFTHVDTTKIDPTLCIEGTSGRLIWAHEKESVAYDSQGNELRRWTLDAEEGSRQHMIREVLTFLQGGNRPHFGAESALAHVEAVQKIRTDLEIEEVIHKPLRDGKMRAEWAPVDGLFQQLVDVSNSRSVVG